jgi:hypothetical protein
MTFHQFWRPVNDLQSGSNHFSIVVATGPIFFILLKVGLFR